MIDIIKLFGKFFLWILLILLIGAIILAFRIFVIDKDYDGNSSSKSGSVTDTVSGNRGSSSDSNSESSSSLSSLGKSVINGAKTIGNATVKGYKEDEDVYTYNAYNFDEAFLMYEGERYEGEVRYVLEHLISNSNGTFYDRTSVTATNFGGGVTIDYQGDVNEYQNAIRTLEESVTDGMYDISFKYGGFGAYINEIVITKK